MKIETLRERIANTEKKIERKHNTIAKKTEWIDKATKKMESADETGKRELEWDIKWLNDDIRRLESEIKESEKTLENYRKQLTGEINRQELLTREVPETLKTLQNELVTEWNRYDKERRDKMIEDYRTLDYHEFCIKYRGQDKDLRYKSDDDINRENEKAAEDIILNLVNRVKGITGEITNWGHLYLNPDNNGWSILNGRVEGKEGVAYVESIGAGGYNIQRYHIRVLVKAR